MKTRIVYEDRDIIVCHKPAGLAVQSAGIGKQDMVSELKSYLKENDQNSGKDREKRSASDGIYLGIVHRLDQPVEGLIVFAKNQKAAASLSRQAAFDLSEQGNGSGTLSQEDKGMIKIYRAEVYGHLTETSGELRDYLIKDGKTNTSRVAKAKDREKFTLAILKYELEERLEETDILKIQLFTGRHHQIRVQFSHAGYPLVGDTKYASEKSAEYNRQKGIRQLALKAVQLEFIHPDTKKKMVFSV